MKSIHYYEVEDGVYYGVVRYVSKRKDWRVQVCFGDATGYSGHVENLLRDGEIEGINWITQGPRPGRTCNLARPHQIAPEDHGSCCVRDCGWCRSAGCF